MKSKINPATAAIKYPASILNYSWWYVSHFLIIIIIIFRLWMSMKQKIISKLYVCIYANHAENLFGWKLQIVLFFLLFCILLDFLSRRIIVAARANNNNNASMKKRNHDFMCSRQANVICATYTWSVWRCHVLLLGTWVEI